MPISSYDLDLRVDFISASKEGNYDKMRSILEGNPDIVNETIEDLPCEGKELM